MNIILLPPSLEPDDVSTNTSVPFGLLSLHAMLKDVPDVCCEILNLPLFYPSEKELARIAGWILSRSPDVVGFSTWCRSYPAQIRLARKLKDLNSGVTVIFGGPQATVTYQETLKQFPFIDYAFLGESELSFFRFVEVIKQGSAKKNMMAIDGLAFIDNGRLFETGRSKLLSDLSLLPFPSYELELGHNPVRLDVGRGCPFNCTYCSTSDFFGRKYRMKSPGHIVDEIRHIKKTFGTTTFHITHDCFTADRNYVAGFCDELMSRGLKVKWSATTRIDCVDRELLQIMAKAGCCDVMYGIESGSTRMQKLIKKNLNLDDMDEAISSAVKNDMCVFCNFIVGFPQETAQDLDDTLKAVMRARCLGSGVGAHILDVLPGTEMFRRYRDKLLYDGYHFSHTACTLSDEEEKMVIDHPEIFSGFYYLDSPCADRGQLKSICSAVKTLNYFPITAGNLRKRWRVARGSGNLLREYLDAQKCEIDKDARTGDFAGFLRKKSAFFDGGEKAIFEVEEKGFSLREQIRPESKGFNLSPEPENIVSSYIVRRDAGWSLIESNRLLKKRYGGTDFTIGKECGNKKYFYAIISRGEYDFDLIRTTEAKYRILEQLRDGIPAIDLWKEIDEILKGSAAKGFWNALFVNELVWVEDRVKSGRKVLRVMLIPPNPARDDSGGGSFINTGLLSIASGPRKMRDVSVCVYNAPLIFKKEADFYRVANAIARQRPDVVGFSTWCHVYAAQVLLARHIKTMLPMCRIIFGGPHASATDYQTLENFPEIDYVIRGEADGAFCKLLAHLSGKAAKSGLGDIPNLTYRKNGRVCRNNVEVVKDLDGLPRPAYDLLKVRDLVPLDVGRGCPHKCSFCSTSSFFSRKFRVKSPDAIIDEIKSVHARFGTESFAILHDNLAANHSYLEQLCRKIIDSNMGIRWCCMSRTDHLDKAALKLLARSGCYLIGYGIETGSARMQKLIRKNLDLAQAGSIIMESKRLGMQPAVSLIMGYPQETRDDLNETLNLYLRLLNLGVDTTLNLLAPLPGTEIYEKNKGSLLYDGFSAVTPHVNLLKGEKEMIKQHPEIFSSFYYLPAISLERKHMRILLDISLFLKTHIYTVKLLSSILKPDGDNDYAAIFERWIKDGDVVQKIKKYGLHTVLYDEIDNHILSKKELLNMNLLLIREIVRLEAFISGINYNYSKSQNMIRYQAYHSEAMIYGQNNWGIFRSRFDLARIIDCLDNGRYESAKMRSKTENYLVTVKNHGDFGYRGLVIAGITDGEACVLKRLPKKLTRMKFDELAGRHLSKHSLDKLLSKLVKNGCIKIIQ